MTPQDITRELITFFGETVQVSEPDFWQIETGKTRLLVLLSEDQSWLRSLVSITSAEEAQPYLVQLLESNFDETQEVRYALYENVLWAVFQHSLASLTVEDFQGAIARLISLQQKGLFDRFNQLAEEQVRQIISAAKQNGQSLEITLQTLDRFYQEGVLGDIDDPSQDRNQILAAWQYQLERLWNEEA
jgi:hypothetical protein